MAITNLFITCCCFVKESRRHVHVHLWFSTPICGPLLVSIHTNCTVQAIGWTNTDKHKRAQIKTSSRAHALSLSLSRTVASYILHCLLNQSGSVVVWSTTGTCLILSLRENNWIFAEKWDWKWMWVWMIILVYGFGTNIVSWTNIIIYNIIDNFAFGRRFCFYKLTLLQLSKQNELSNDIF